VTSARTENPSAAEGTRLPAAVLWDMDGTLVDTEPYWLTCEFELVEAFGGSWSDADSEAILGSPLLVSAEYMRVNGGIDLPAEEIVSRLLDRMVRTVRRRTPWQPGARELLDGLVAAGVPCALVTQSYRVLAEAVLDVLPPGTFAAVVTGEQVRNGKPHPEPYLEAARRLGVPAAECVAIEDSPAGVTSAAAAGAAVLAVARGVPVPDGPDREVVTTLEGVTPAHLARLVRATTG